MATAADRGGAGSLAIRPATVDDALAIATVHVRSWQSAYGGLLPQDYLDALRPADRLEAWQGALAATAWPATGTFVLVDRGSVSGAAPAPAPVPTADVVIGFASISPTRDPDGDPQSVGELQTLYLDPSAWRAGGGSALLGTVQRQFAAAGYTSVTAWVLETNERARRFYERHHWAADGTSKPHDWGAFVVTDVRYAVALV